MIFYSDERVTVPRFAYRRAGGLRQGATKLLPVTVKTLHHRMRSGHDELLGRRLRSRRRHGAKI